jgi:hypothetical protein
VHIYKLPEKQKKKIAKELIKKVIKDFNIDNFIERHEQLYINLAGRTGLVQR